jgi:hypothetical protein
LEQDVLGPKVTVIQHLEPIGTGIVVVHGLLQHTGGHGLQLLVDGFVDANCASVFDKCPEGLGEEVQVGHMVGVEGAPGEFGQIGFVLEKMRKRRQLYHIFARIFQGVAKICKKIAPQKPLHYYPLSVLVSTPFDNE